MNLLGAISQTLDFVWKALVNYAATDEGKQELEDIYQAWSGDPDPQADNVPNGGNNG